MALNAADLSAPIQVFQLLLGRCMQAVTRALSEAGTIPGPPRLPLQLPMMSSQHIQPLLELDSIDTIETLRGSYAVSNIVAVLFLSLWLWRIWRFTISPSLHLEQPRELPYWIPEIDVQLYNPSHYLHLSVLVHVG